MLSCTKLISAEHLNIKYYAIFKKSKICSIIVWLMSENKYHVSCKISSDLLRRNFVNAFCLLYLFNLVTVVPHYSIVLATDEVILEHSS